MSVLDIYTKQFTSVDNKHFIVSNDGSLIDLETVNQALASPRMYWARAMSISELQNMITNSVCFGVYEKAEGSDTGIGSMVGFARLITDRTTFVYLTDVWISESRTGCGLGTWLIDCVNEWINMVPHLRQFLLLTGDSRAPFYMRKLNMGRIEDNPGLATLVRKGPAGTLSSGS